MFVIRTIDQDRPGCHTRSRRVSVPVSYTFERKENEASWENDPYINPYGNQGIFLKLLRCIHDNFEQGLYCWALLLTRLAHSSFSFFPLELLYAFCVKRGFLSTVISRNHLSYRTTDMHS